MFVISTSNILEANQMRNGTILVDSYTNQF